MCVMSVCGVSVVPVCVVYGAWTCDISIKEKYVRSTLCISLKLAPVPEAVWI